MPVLDTSVVFAAADPRDALHSKALKFLTKLGRRYVLATFALIEFDIVLKSRGFSHNERMEKFALLIRDFPAAAKSVHRITPTTLYLAALHGRDFGLEYFDAGVAAEAVEHDGAVISADKAFDIIPSLRRSW